MSQKHSFLFELGMEELPAQVLQQMSQIFEHSIRVLLHEAQLNFGELTSFATPRRLSVLIKELDGQQKDEIVVLRGPSVKAAFDENGNILGPAKGFAAS